MNLKLRRESILSEILTVEELDEKREVLRKRIIETLDTLELNEDKMNQLGVEGGKVPNDYDKLKKIDKQLMMQLL